MRTWIYLQNSFESSTVNSYRNCQKIAHHTLIALHGQISNPFFATLHAELQPFVQAYGQAYLDWAGQKGKQKSRTISLQRLLKELRNSKIQEWDIQIQQLYRQRSMEYIRLLPYRRVPFQKGSQGDIISSVGALVLMLQAIPALAATLQDVAAFYDKLQIANGQQLQNKSSTKQYSTAVEHARVAVCTELYAVLGALMRYYKGRPQSVATFFDTKTIRRHEQSRYQRGIKAGMSRLVLTHTFLPGDALRIVNRGGTELVFWLGATAQAAVGQPVVRVAPMAELHFLAADLGDVAMHRFLKVQNLSAVQDGAYTLQLL
ncbi:MAG: hypothetical protein IT256_06700 [Chitinophagaceae bacterium]|nr:hypothetical protein [Chitinophagaceae bacterium]